MSKKLSHEKIQKWKNDILEQQESGFSIDLWCNKNDIIPHKFHYWKKKLFPSDLTRSSFTELKNEKQTATYFEYNGIKLHVDRSTDPIILKKCLKALIESRC
jgi:hypothetical protein